MQVQEVTAQVEQFIRTRFRVRPDDTFFSPEVNLWEEGYIDSTGAVELIAFLEQSYHIRLSEEVLFDPDFTHISGIGRLVDRALRAQAAA
jgi:acyl carrier protein